jgi:thiol-disulfide isomerase/thioredoxin
MRRTHLAACLVAAFMGLGAKGGDDENAVRAAPPFPSTDAKNWIGTPVTWPELRGQVVMIDVWTFGCVNCIRTVPWIREVSARYAERGFKVIGVHTPEFDNERGASAVRAAVKKHQLDYPHYIDNSQAYWEALHAHGWPSTYLVDRCGRIRARHAGEVHSDDASGRGMEQAIEALLDEKECTSS